MKGKVRVSNLTHEQVLSALSYNPSNGEFRWKISPAKNIKIGDRAGGSGNKNKYRFIKIGNEEVTEGRLAWFYMNGYWPDRRIRYKNGDPTDCRYENLTMFNGLAGEFDHKTREGRQAYQNAYRKLTPIVQKARALRDSFGMSLEQYDLMLAKQDNKCAICGNFETHMRNGKIKALAVDHNHKTGQIRALLCSDCNTAIGKFKENTEYLKNAISYLDTYSNSENSVVE